MVSWFRRKPQGLPAVPSAVRGALEMHKPWARSSSHRLPNTSAGAFLSITNKGPDDDRLVAASSPLAERIELHGIKVVGSDIDMRPMANGVAIQARPHDGSEAARLPSVAAGPEGAAGQGIDPAGHADLREGRRGRPWSLPSRSPARSARRILNVEHHRG